MPNRLLWSSTSLLVPAWTESLRKSIHVPFSLIFHFPHISSKSFQKTLQKQGMKFKLSTKVISAKKNAEGKVDVVVEPSAGGAQETVRLLSISIRFPLCFIHFHINPLLFFP